MCLAVETLLVSLTPSSSCPLMTEPVGFFYQTQGSPHVSAKELPLFGLPALQSLSELRLPKCFHLSPLSGSSSPLGSSQYKEPGFPGNPFPGILRSQCSIPLSAPYFSLHRAHHVSGGSPYGVR